MRKNKQTANRRRRNRKRGISKDNIMKKLETCARYHIACYLVSRFPEIPMQISVTLPVSNSTVEFFSTINFNRVFDHLQYTEIKGRAMLLRVGESDYSVIPLSPLPRDCLDIPNAVSDKIKFEEICQKLRLVLDEGVEKYVICGAENSDINGMFRFQKISDSEIETIDQEVGF